VFLPWSSTSLPTPTPDARSIATTPTSGVTSRRKSRSPWKEILHMIVSTTAAIDGRPVTEYVGGGDRDVPQATRGLWGKLGRPL
jgi:hypothetical protein